MKIAAGMSEEFAARVRRLRADFVATFPERVRVLEEWCGAAPLDREGLGRLRTEIHQLKGSAGMYQLDALFKAAREAETLVDEMLQAKHAGPSPDVNLDVAMAPLLAVLSRQRH